MAPPRLLVNNGVGVLSDVTATQLPAVGTDHLDVTTADVDGDGDLDLDVLLATPGGQNRLLNNAILFPRIQSYVGYDHDWRTHRPLKMDTPASRIIQPPALGPVKKLSGVGGLPHHYERQAA